VAAPKSPGDLRQRITFQRRLTASDGYGNHQGDWADLFTRWASINPTRGGEEIQAGRIAGKATWDLWMRNDGQGREVVTGDRAIDQRDKTRTFNIVFGPVDMYGDGKFLFCQLQSGVADG